VTRKLKRTAAYELSVEIRDPEFIRPPRDAQRNWLLNRFVREAGEDLEALDRIARRFVAGGDRDLPPDMRDVALADDEIMEDWQLPLMDAMAAIAARSHGDVLEIGFGRGVSAEAIQRLSVRSHTIVECNPHVIARFDRWRATLPSERDIRIVPGLWQDVIDSLGEFDAVFFHTYALDADEAVDLLSNSVTFAAGFFPVAAAHLRAGGVFTYLTNEIDSLSRAHQRLLFDHFGALRMHPVALAVPSDVRDAWWADSMVVVEATK
jgi:guanidinoacetate N-methyltransferase